MRRLRTISAACLAMLCAACVEDRPPPAAVVLPDPPADLRACFRQAKVVLPDRDLTVGDVERFWKEDRRRGDVMRRCGRRALAWYDDLKKRFR